jgi:hypothetical protein
MSLKSTVKRIFFGPPGERPRRVHAGLVKGHRFIIDVAGKSMRLVGLDEREIAGCTRKAAEGARTAVDVGTNDGWYALYFASHPTIRKVWGFEPDAGLIDRARENLRLNREEYVSRTVLTRKFVGNTDDVQWCRLDTVLAGAEYPMVFKIDVDGGEMEVLRGAKSTLAGGRCSLVIETHSPELERDCLAFLKDLGYHCRIVKNAWYRAIVPESRNIPHNRWLVATRDR